MLNKLWRNNTIWSIISVLLNVIINFTLVPFVSNTLGIEAYGFVTLSNTVVTYIDIVSVAVNAFACRFIAISYHKNDLRKANLYYSSSFYSNLVLTVCLAVIGLICIPNLHRIINISETLDTDVKILFGLVTVRYSLVLFRTVFEVSTFIINRIDIAEKAKTCSYIIQTIVLLIWATLIKKHIWYVAVSTTLAALFLLIVHINCSIIMTPSLRIHRKSFSVKCIIELVSAGVWNSLNNVGNLLNSGLDLLIANKMLTGIIVGNISVSKTLGSLCYTFVTAISTSFRPKQLEAYSRNDLNGLINKLKFSMSITGVISTMFISGFIAVGNDFLKLWIPNENTQLIYNLCVIVLLGDVIIGVINPLYYVFTLTNKMKLPCLVTIGMGITNVVTMYVLLSYTSYGAYAVVLTTMVLNLLHFIDTPLYCSYCLKISYRTFYPTILRHIINISVCTAFLTATYKFIFTSIVSWAILIIGVLVLGLECLLISIPIAFSKEQRKILFGMANSIYKR